MFGRTGNQQQYNINVSGGTKQMTYSVSYAHNEEKSIMLNSGFKKDNVNAKIKSELNKWMTLDFNARLSYSTIDGLGGGADTNESNAANSTVLPYSVRLIHLNTVMTTKKTVRHNRNLHWNVCLQRIKPAILSTRTTM